MAKKQTTARSKRHSKRRLIAKHVVASLTYVAPHKHTGKRLKHRHTSHGLLLLILAVTGAILFLSLATFNAAGITGDGQVRVRLQVPGDAPTVGAAITNPLNQSRLKQALLVVDGTCPVNTIVAIYKNGHFASSRFCRSDGSFHITIQLTEGSNTLQAQNYDTLFQAGPKTDQITVVYDPSTSETPVTPTTPIANTPSDTTIDTSITPKPAAQPGKNPCDNPTAPAAQTQLGLTTKCVTRNVFVGETLRLPVTLWGGIAPYALSVDWGDDKRQLYSFSAPGQYILSHTYLVPQIKSIGLHLADAKGASYQMETAIEINANDEAVQPGTFGSTPINSLAQNWIDASIPLYWGAVTLIGGFWIGDIFQRVFGTKKVMRRRA